MEYKLTFEDLNMLEDLAEEIYLSGNYFYKSRAFDKFKNILQDMKIKRQIISSEED